MGSSQPPEEARPAALRLGLWSAALAAVVLAVNAAGVWEIASALRGLREQAARTLTLGTAARARGVESVVSSATADLAFMVGSAALGTGDASEGRSWHDEVGSALLVFLRGHPEVKNLIVRDRSGKAAVEAGRPRDVPGYWIPGPASPSLDVRTAAIRREFDIPARAGAPGGPASLLAVLDPPALLRASHGEGVPVLDCSLLEADGSPLAVEAGPVAAGPDEPVSEAAVTAAGWGAPDPWRLRCRASVSAPAAELEPLVARHRTAVAVNLAVMILAIVLGAFALHQSRQRWQLEVRAREETRVRELERQLFHAERLSTVGRLAASMAHEINNPLEGMSNYLRLAADALDRDSLDVARLHMEGVRHGLTRAAGIVRRVLDHAHPGKFVSEEVELTEVMERALEFVRSRNEFSSIRFATDFPTDGVRVMGSGVMLGQVFLNLLLNACEAQPLGGEVLLSCRRDGAWAEGDVSDRGPGVPASRRSSIFEPFESTKQSAGLGLSICHSIVRQHEGELSVHDRQGGGSTFRVRLKAGGRVEGARQPA